MTSASSSNVIEKLFRELEGQLFRGLENIDLNDFDTVKEYDEKKLKAKEEVERAHSDDLRVLNPSDMTRWRCALAALNGAVER